MGNQDYSLRFLVIFWFFLASLISLAMAFTGTAPEWYLLVFLGITVFNLSILLIPEAAETLVNPVEGLILAHQPVNGATWSAAKLTHLVRAVVYVVAGVNGVPALIGFFLPHGDGISMAGLSLGSPSDRLGCGDGIRPALLQPVRLADSLCPGAAPQGGCRPGAGGPHALTCSESRF